MPPAKPPQLSLDPGSVIHIKGFTGAGGFAPKDKFLFIVGPHSPAVVLGFRITSQTTYRTSNLAKELVVVPVGSTPCLKKESFIQCFHDVERLKVDELRAGHLKGLVVKTGDLSALMNKVRETVELSDILSPDDIADTLAAIDRIVGH